jgi:hypothetical protein
MIDLEPLADVAFVLIGNTDVTLEVVLDTMPRARARAIIRPFIEEASSASPMVNGASNKLERPSAQATAS